jgi:hypothetical protein
MREMKSLLVVFILLGSCLGCVGEEPTGVNALEFRLVAVDGDGREKSVFESGERIGIGAKLINHSRDEYLSYTPFACWMQQFASFTEVYVCSANIKGERMGIARYNTVNCLGVPVRIPAKSERSIIVHYWDENPKNEPIPIGKYCSFVKAEGIIDGTSVPINLEVSFEVR